jgi:hypothetical protein
MWMIRSGQVEALRQSSLSKFEDDMVKHLQGFIPKLATVLGDAALRTVIRYGVERARTYEFTSRACVRFFIEMIVLFGAEFDTDPQYPWALEALTEQPDDDQTIRGQRLFHKAKEYLETVSGPGRSHVKEALRRSRQEPFEGPPVGAPDFAKQVKERFYRVYPQKCEFLGERAFDGLIQRGLEESRQHSVTSDAGTALFIGLMFTVGHGMVRDPHLPWIGRTLGNGANSDPNRRAERLYSKAMTYLDEILDSLH